VPAGLLDGSGPPKRLSSWDDVDVLRQQITSTRRHFWFPASRTVDRFDTSFDHAGLIADTGLIVMATMRCDSVRNVGLKQAAVRRDVPHAVGSD